MKPQPQDKIEKIQDIINRYRGKWQITSISKVWWEKAFRECYYLGKEVELARLRQEVMKIEIVKAYSEEEKDRFDDMEDGQLMFRNKVIALLGTDRTGDKT